MPNANLLKTSYSRVFIADGGAGPAAGFVYQGLARAGRVAWPQGNIQPIRVPSAQSYDQFDIVDTIKGQRGLPTLPIEFRMQANRSDILALIRKGCNLDLQVHIGRCKTPTDFNGGWADGKILVLQDASSTDYGTDDIGALDADKRAMVMETTPFVGLDYYEITPLTPSLESVGLVNDEVIDINIPDAISCGACGLPSDGKSVYVAIVKSSTGSPGLPPKVVYTLNGGFTWASLAVTSMGLAEVPTAIGFLGGQIIIASNAGLAFHYAPLTQIAAGAAVWTKQVTGLVAGGGPNQMIVVGNAMWVAADGGYIYYTTDISGGVIPQTNGAVTTQSLKGIAAYDRNVLIAVGASNTVLVTANGGQTWSVANGPLAAVTLNAVAVRDYNSYFTVTSTGRLFYSRDGGATWAERTFVGSGAGNIRDIVFATKAVGYLAYDTNLGPVAKIYRTVDGGFSWYALPEGTNSIFPTTPRINAIAVPQFSGDNANLVIGAGLGTGGATSGVLIKAA